MTLREYCVRAEKPSCRLSLEVFKALPIGPFLWAMLFDEIHHRGQLAAYLRPMGGKVPAIYGPSADAQPKSMAMIS